MSRRGRSGPTISLFSFQDIITSVTAIITVITLLLALDLVQRKQSHTTNLSGRVSADMTRRLFELEAEYSRLSTQVDLSDELMKEVADSSPADLHEEIAHRELALIELNTKLTQQKEYSVRLNNRLKAAEMTRYESASVHEEIEEAIREAVELEQQLETEQEYQRTVFSLPRGFNKTGWIAVIEKDRIQMAPIGRVEAPVTIKSSGIILARSDLAGELLKWIEREQLRSAYFLLLVRPDAVTNFEKVDQLLSDQKILHGFDLVRHDENIMHPERGAAP